MGAAGPAEQSQLQGLWHLRSRAGAQRRPRFAPSHVYSSLGVYHYACLQVPTFNLFSASSTLAVSMHKTTSLMLATARVLVVAFNAGPDASGSAIGWRSGLNENATVQLGQPVACPEQPCSTIWLHFAAGLSLESAGASVAVRFMYHASDFTESAASLNFEARASRMREGSYPFELHIPIRDGLAWTTRNISGVLNVTTHADASLSAARLCQGANCSSSSRTTFLSANNGAAPISVRISLVDVDGYPIRRDGETATIILRQGADDKQTIRALYASESFTYVAYISGLVLWLVITLCFSKQLWGPRKRCSSRLHAK